jgi:hypothetical protein
VNHPLVRRRHVRLAPTYAQRFPQEIEPLTAGGERPFAELRGLNPFLQLAD